MTKLEEIKDNEWECILSLINAQISVNEDILNEYRWCDFDVGELELVTKEQELLKSSVRKLEKMKGKVLFTYD